MSQPLLALGDHIFEILPLNYQRIERETVAKWPAIARFGQRAARQFTGLGEDQLVISGLMCPEEFGGRDEYEAIRVTQGAGQPVMMAGMASWSSARIFGRVVILTVSDAQHEIAPNGQGQILEFSVTVAPYE
jgi:hypothetical protein